MEEDVGEQLRFLKIKIREALTEDMEFRGLWAKAENAGAYRQSRGEYKYTGVIGWLDAPHPCYHQPSPTPTLSEILSLYPGKEEHPDSCIDRAG